MTLNPEVVYLILPPPVFSRTLWVKSRKKTVSHNNNARQYTSDLYVCLHQVQEYSESGSVQIIIRERERQRGTRGRER